MEMSFDFCKIGVLMGGPSSEREISLKSGKAVYQSLNQVFADTIAIDIKTEDREENIDLIEAAKIDCAFLALHGKFGEDGQIQEILDGLGLAYTGSGALASRLAMDKIASRRIFRNCGLAVPRCGVADRQASGSFYLESIKNFKFPLVVKPASHGSSVGLSMVDNKHDLSTALDLAFNFDQQVLIEEYIPGREFTVGILDESALPVVEIISKKRLFDFQAKYQAGLTEYIVPAEIEEAVKLKLQQAALKAHQALACYGCSRVDIILSEDKTPFVLEINTIPGFTETSLLPKAAKAEGIDFFHLCTKLIQLAYEKKKVQCKS